MSTPFPQIVSQQLGSATEVANDSNSSGQGEPHAVQPSPADFSLIDLVLEQTSATHALAVNSTGSGTADGIGLSDQHLLEMAFGEGVSLGQVRSDPMRWRSRAKTLLGHMIAEIDQLLTDQINAVLHHHRFQSLEASWRGLWSLVDQADRERVSPIMVKLLPIRRREWINDMTHCVAFDKSQLFIKVYEEEFGMPGGLPYGLMIADFEVGRSPEDVAAMEGLAGVAAASFCPTILSAAPSLLGLDSWTELPLAQDYEASFRSPEFVRWRRLRESDDAKYTALTAPRVLVRKPYDGRETSGFIFREDSSDPRGSGYLWGSAIYAFAGVVLRSFSQSRWLADVRGVERGVEGGGLVTDLPKHHFTTDRPSVAPKTSLEVILTDRQEAELSRLGFLCLSHCPDTDFAAFYNTSSLQKPREYNDPGITANARIGAMLQYTLCVSRFAHYLKVMGRDWIGSGVESEELQRRLDRWLKRYVADDASLSIKIKAERPLRKAEVAVERHPTQPGCYQCVIELWPHYQVDQLTASVQLKTTFLNRLVS
jgi:type VI secretion system ImpC/EvpB family protein